LRTEALADKEPRLKRGSVGFGRVVARIPFLNGDQMLLVAHDFLYENTFSVRSYLSVADYLK
jgi:hypothetical protein